MMNELVDGNAVETEVVVKREDINKLVVLSVMFGFANYKGVSEACIKRTALEILEKSNEELNEVIKGLDSTMWCKRKLLSYILHNIEEFQQSFDAVEWKLLKEETANLVKKDIYSILSLCDELDWYDLLVDVISEFRKIGILLVEVSINHGGEAIYYYLFDPHESVTPEIRDFVLNEISYNLDVIIEEYGHHVPEDLLKKVWNKRDEELKPTFWETKSEKLREQFWKELFICGVCDSDIEDVY